MSVNQYAEGYRAGLLAAARRVGLVGLSDNAAIRDICEYIVLELRKLAIESVGELPKEAGR